MARVPKSALTPLANSPSPEDMNTGERTQALISAITAAGRIRDSLEIGAKPSQERDDVLLAPLEALVTPLPHQLNALKKAVSSMPSRFLLADEVGLGKTIEAGLIMRELKLRGLVKRTLIVAPAGLVRQWIAEMRRHFKERFYLFTPRELERFSELFMAASDLEQDSLTTNTDDDTFNPWQLRDNVICTLDAIKPLNKRKGWSKRQIDERNEATFLRVLHADWDLIIIDEAHRLAGADTKVARFKLGLGLGQSTPNLLMLSATPHSGKRDAFQRLLSILDDEAFYDQGKITRQKVAPYMIRHEKRSVVDGRGERLFKERITHLDQVMWEERHKLQRQLYGQVTLYIQEVYRWLRRIAKQEQQMLEFLLLLMQRLAASSTVAVRVSMEKRLAFLMQEKQQIPEVFTELDHTTFSELDGDAQLSALLATAMELQDFEIQTVKDILTTARKAEADEIDAKAERLLGLIYELQAQENESNLKILIFTEFTATQRMLVDFLCRRGFTVTFINGGLSLDERMENQKLFSRDIQIMVSTEAGGEGLNLQFCHVVVNYDLPWNPMRIEQRIGRVDRIGQEHVVHAVNLTLQETVENRVRGILEQKLKIILQQLGIDKIGDVLDSAETGVLLDNVYGNALREPEKLDERIEDALEQISKQALINRNMQQECLPSDIVEPEKVTPYLTHPFHWWMERMATNYLRVSGGQATANLGGWDLCWPDGCQDVNVVFDNKTSDIMPDSTFISIQDQRIKEMIDTLTHPATTVITGIVTSEAWPVTVAGIWSLWKITVSNNSWNHTRIAPLFINENGQVFLPTAHKVWDDLLAGNFHIISSSEDVDMSPKLLDLAETQFSGLYQEIMALFNQQRMADRERHENLFAARKRMIQRVGIANIRDARIKNLTKQHESWINEWNAAPTPLPGLELLLNLKLRGVGHG